MQQKQQSLDYKTLWRVIQMAQPHKRLFYLSIALSILLAPISTISPYIVKNIVDDHILQKDIQGLWYMSLLFFGVLLLHVFMRYLFIYYIADLGQSVVKDLRTKVFSHIVSLRLRYFDTTPIGTSTTRTINDIQAINEVFTQGVITIIADLLAVITVIIIMFYTSWQLAVISLSTLPLMLWATYVFKEKVKVSYQNVRTQLANMNTFLQERISGMRVVQLFNAQEQERQKFKSINHDYTTANLDSVFYYAVFFPVVELISAISLALMVWLGAGAYLHDSVSFGALVAFPLYVDLLFRPVRMAADKFNTLQMGLVAAERVFNLLDNNEIISNEGSFKPTKIHGNLAFQNVHFSYDQVNYVLNDVSFALEAGKKLAIVGSTGSGKSTIVNLVSRFYDIQQGSITLDNKDIKEYELTNLRTKIAIVLQDVFLFYGTVYENITLKDGNVSKADVIEAAKLIGIHSYIMQLPNDYDFVVMERGQNLSVGQRQLISFVRALVSKPDILILDEATSSIDNEAERIIQEAIEKLTTNRTSIIIAHRLTTIRHADYIMVMDQGKVVEFGHHDELIQLPDGRYRELYELQFAEKGSVI